MQVRGWRDGTKSRGEKGELMQEEEKHSQSSQGGGAVCFSRIKISWRCYLKNSGVINKLCAVS